MGIESSIPEELASNFGEGEIGRLAKRFRKLDINKSGTLSKEEIMLLPGIRTNPLSQRILSLFDTDGNGEINFTEFIQVLSQFSIKGDKITKLRFAFRIYDLDNDGFISRDDLIQVLKKMVHKSFLEDQVEDVVNRMMSQIGKEKDGLISFEEFLKVVGDTNVHEKMVVNM